MKEHVLIDTGFWIALLDQRDQNHAIAKNGLPQLLKEYQVCISDFILFETLTYINCSLKRNDLALQFLSKTDSPNILVFTVDEMVKSQALEWFKKYSGHALSITDCTSFALMKSKNIQWYAGFDKHFTQMGYQSVLEQFRV